MQIKNLLILFYLLPVYTIEKKPTFTMMHPMRWHLQYQDSIRGDMNWQGTWFNGFHFDGEACPGCVRLLTVESDQEWGRLSYICLTVGSWCCWFTAYSKITKHNKNTCIRHVHVHVLDMHVQCNISFSGIVY